MRLARELGYTISEVMERMTYDEIFLWGVLFEIEEDEREEAARKAKRR
jgi:hypothetical protein